MNEPELISSCKKGDRKAQEQLFTVYSDRLFRISFRYLKNDLEAEDVLIIAFNKAFANIKSFESKGAGSLEAWLKRIVVNEALMELRRKHNFNLTESIEEHHGISDVKDFSESSAEDIYAMITDLPIGYRTVFNLSVVEGYSHEEIAAMLGIHPGTSRSQLFKAKSLLKEMLTREGFNYGT